MLRRSLSKVKMLRPNDFGKTYLVEQCQKVPIKNFLKSYRGKMKELFLASELEEAGIKVELTASRGNFGGILFWFKCPKCDRRIGVLFMHPVTGVLGCRKCLNLEYRKRRYKGMVECLA